LRYLRLKTWLTAATVDGQSDPRVIVGYGWRSKEDRTAKKHKKRKRVCAEPAFGCVLARRGVTPER